MSIFIDPIDGTREFSTNKGEQSSVCIGFSDKAGLPVGKFGGVIEKFYFSILVVSCFMWSGALDSSGVFLSYLITSLASHMTNILIPYIF